MTLFDPQPRVLVVSLALRSDCPDHEAPSGLLDFLLLIAAIWGKCSSERV